MQKGVQALAVACVSPISGSIGIAARYVVGGGLWGMVPFGEDSPPIYSTFR